MITKTTILISFLTIGLIGTSSVLYAANSKVIRLEQSHAQLKMQIDQIAQVTSLLVEPGLSSSDSVPSLLSRAPYVPSDPHMSLSSTGTSNSALVVEGSPAQDAAIVLDKTGGDSAAIRLKNTGDAATLVLSVKGSNGLSVNMSGDVEAHSKLKAKDLVAGQMTATGSLDTQAGSTTLGDTTLPNGKTIDVSAGTLTLANDQISGDKVEGGTIAATTIGTLTSTNVNSATVSATTLTSSGASVALGAGKTLDTQAGSTALGDTTLSSGKTLDVSAGTLNLADNQISGDKVEGGVIGATTINTLTSTTVNTGTVSASTLTSGGSTVSLGSGKTLDTQAGSTTLGNTAVPSGKTLDVSAGVLNLADDQISGDKVEGGTINSITINTVNAGVVKMSSNNVNGKICKGDGTNILCNADESDPQVGTVSTSGKWCRSDGSAVQCDQNVPVLTETDPQVGAVTSGKYCRGDGSQVQCDKTVSLGPVSAEIVASSTCSGDVDTWLMPTSTHFCFLTKVQLSSGSTSLSTMCWVINGNNAGTDTWFVRAYGASCAAVYCAARCLKVYTEA